MVSALFDTNVLIDYLNSVPEARAELGRYDDQAISIVTWMEVMVGATPETEDGTRNFLDGFALIPLDSYVAERAVFLRKEKRLRLPDAIVWASAQIQGRLLVSCNAKDFPAGDPGVRLPYKL